MIFKTLVIIGLLGGNAAAHDMKMKMHLRANNEEAETVRDTHNYDAEHLDLEVVVAGGERKLFPLLPGTKCPTGHTCRVRNEVRGITPLVPFLKNGMKTELAASVDWNEFNKELTSVVNGDNYCSRRQAMTRAAAVAAGVALTTVSSPAFAAETKVVQMGTDSGGLKFVPEKTTICKGDSVKWVNNKGGPHNVVFDEDTLPAGVSQEKISMDEQLGEEGDTFTMSFDTVGAYDYYCEPHRGAGMAAMLTVA